MTEKTQRIFRQVVKQVCPPIVLSGVKMLVKSLTTPRTSIVNSSKIVVGQDLDVYWDAEMAQILETWGEKNVWKEIQLLIVNCQGKVLDVACGTGKTMELISKFSVDIHGCDISDLLIGMAVDRGILQDRLTVCDATKMPYQNDFFNYAYSIGSLEHFTEEGITAVLRECKRVVHKTSFHMVPVSRSGKDEGWLKTHQSFHNNSVDWWLKKYQAVYKTVYILDSTWEDQISVGKWFVCNKGITN